MLRRLTGASPNPPRLAITADAVGGVWTYALDLASGLGRRGVSTILVVCGPAPSQAQRRAAATVPHLELVETGAPLDWTAHDQQELAQAARAVAAVVRERGVDLVHLDSPALAAFADFGVPVLGVCHSCLATWWNAVKQGPPPADFEWRIKATAAGYAACAALVAPTGAFAAATAESYGIAPPHVVVNGRTPAPVQAARAAQDRVVLTAGRLWDEAKDLRTLERAAGGIEASVVALGPLAAPDGTRVSFDRLRTPGSLDADAVAAEMAAAAIFVSTARYEPFGLAVLEAAQAGLPLVLSDIPTFRELWAGVAQFVAAGDAAGFATAVNRLLASPEACRQAGAAARNHAERYSVAAMAQGYLDLYGSLGVGAAGRAVPA